jgi:hypothetical protein
MVGTLGLEKGAMAAVMKNDKGTDKKTPCNYGQRDGKPHGP